VYLRVLEEAALRRIVALGFGSTLLGRAVDIVYRKPSFAGEALRVAQQAFEQDGRFGVVAMLVEEDDAASEDSLLRARPRVVARMIF
jgi:hypothetical protein